MSKGPPVVAVFNSNDDTVELIRAWFERVGIVVVSAHLDDIKRDGFDLPSLCRPAPTDAAVGSKASGPVDVLGSWASHTTWITSTMMSGRNRRRSRHNRRATPPDLNRYCLAQGPSQTIGIFAPEREIRGAELEVPASGRAHTRKIDRRCRARPEHSGWATGGRALALSACSGSCSRVTLTSVSPGPSGTPRFVARVSKVFRSRNRLARGARLALSASVAVSALALVVFHLVLFWDQIVNGRLFDAAVAVRWG